LPYFAVAQYELSRHRVGMCRNCPSVESPAIAN
jgi:hypothetical protein